MKFINIFKFTICEYWIIQKITHHIISKEDIIMETAKVLIGKNIVGQIWCMHS